MRDVPLARVSLSLIASLFPIQAAGLNAQPPSDVPPEGEVRLIGSRLELFVDDWLIERMQGVRREVHPPVRRDIAFTFDAPWEGGQSGYCTILHDGGRYRLYYRGGGDLGREHTCVAFSDDGVRWTRPSLGLFEFNGSGQNNIIWTGEKNAYWESHNFSPFLDENPAAPPTQRWKAVSLSRATPAGESERRKVLMGFFSSDGIHWKRIREEPIITDGGFDSHNVAFWDAVEQRYVCYLRSSLDGKRNVSRSVSTDFVVWSRPVHLDYGDAPTEQFYTNGILPYFRAPHLKLGFPMRFVPPSERNFVGFQRRKTDGLSDAVIMSSRDGLHWDRPFLEAFLRPGLDPGQWGGAHGNSMPVWGLVQTGPAEISFYWAEHYGNYPEGTSRVPRIARGTLRLDGFVSAHAGYTGGELVTRPLVFEGAQLVVNFSTSAVGSIRVEILDADGEPIPGFRLDDAVEIWGDEINRIVEWRQGHDVGSLAGRPVRLRFVMKDADLYAIRFLPSTGEHTPTDPLPE